MDVENGKFNINKFNQIYSQGELNKDDEGDREGYHRQGG